MNSGLKIIILLLLGILLANLSEALTPLLFVAIIMAVIIGIKSYKDEEKGEESAQSSNSFNNQDDKEENTYQSSQTNHESDQWPEDRPIMTRGGGKRTRNRIFQANTLLQGGVIRNNSDKERLYTSAISIIALFSWVMRKDGDTDEKEVNVAQLYFEKHSALNRILKLFPNGMERDPITGAEHISTDNSCMQMLLFYNTCPKMLRCSMCCRNILASGIYYTAAMDLIKALLQVAYTIDGVIEPEWKILQEIAQELKILKADWKNLEQKYMQMRGYSSSQKKSSSGKNNSEKEKTDRKQSKWQEEKRSQQQQQEQTKKSSTFGYKLTQAYNQLGLLTTATEPEVKAAFRLLVKKYHPDHLPSDATDMERKISVDQFRQVMEAYDLIRLEKGM